MQNHLLEYVKQFSGLAGLCSKACFSPVLWCALLSIIETMY